MDCRLDFGFKTVFTLLMYLVMLRRRPSGGPDPSGADELMILESFSSRVEGGMFEHGRCFSNQVRRDSTLVDKADSTRELLPFMDSIRVDGEL
jgi:hypothetical protein